jgi:large subunit ribosomal protein L18
MAKNAIYTVHYRRKREGKTHYGRRLELLKSSKPRLIIRRSNTAINIQFVTYEKDGDKVLATFHSSQLEKYGWKYSKKSLPAAYLAGLAAGKLVSKQVKEAILDLGLQTPHKGSKLYAALKGVIDAGVAIPCSETVFPSEDRLSGKHIATSGQKYTGYEKAKVEASKITDEFQATKEKILA